MNQIATDQGKTQDVRTKVMPAVPVAAKPAGEEPRRTRERDLIITDARMAINGEREREYGEASENFDRIAELWGVVFDRHISVEQVALCMDLVKTARLIVNPKHRDSWVDKVGYSALGGELSDSDSK